MLPTYSKAIKISKVFSYLTLSAYIDHFIDEVKDSPIMTMRMANIYLSMFHSASTEVSH